MNNFVRKTKELLQGNSEFGRIIGYILIGCIVVTMIFIIYMLGTTNNESTIDDPSGEKLLTINTGADTTNNIQAIGFDILTKNGIDENTYRPIIDAIISYFTYQYPHYDRISYRQKDGLKIEDGKQYFFNAESNTGKIYSITINVNTTLDYNFTIKERESKLFEYNSKEVAKITKNKQTLSKHLPHTFKLSNGINAKLTIRSKDKKIELALNSCGDEGLKKEADTLAKEWLESISYNPEEIHYEIPNYCDGGAK